MANSFTNQGAKPGYPSFTDSLKQIFAPKKTTSGLMSPAPVPVPAPVANSAAYGGANYVSPSIPVTSKFGSSGTSDYAKPQTPPKTTTGLLPTTPAPVTKAPDDPSYKFNALTGILNPKYVDPNVKPPVPVTSNNPAIQAGNVGKAGEQTGNEKDTQRHLEDAGAVTEWENSIRNGASVEEANKRLTDFRMALAKKYGDIESQAIPLEFQQGREQVLARQAASQEGALQQGVQNALAEQGQQFSAAGTQAARGLSAEQQAFTGAQNQAQRSLGAQQSVLQAGLPGQISPGVGAYNPLTGQNIPGVGADPFKGGVIQGNVQLGQQYAGMNAANQAASGIKNSIQSLLTQVPLNPTTFSDVNKVIQLLSGKVSDPNYQTLSNYLNEYISTLAPILGVGGDTTNLKTEIAQSMINAQASGQSISTVLDNLESLANAKLAAIANAGQGGSPTPGGTTGGFAETWE